MTSEAAFQQLGWCRFPRDPGLENWVASVLEPACETVRDPQLLAEWLRCGGTWFAGVNALGNDGKGRVGNGPELRGLLYPDARAGTKFRQL